MKLDIKLLLNHKRMVEYLSIDIEEGNGLNKDNEIYDEDVLKNFIRKTLGFKSNTEINFTTMNTLGSDPNTFNQIYVDGDVIIIINSEDEYKFYHRQKVLAKIL